VRVPDQWKKRKGKRDGGDGPDLAPAPLVHFSLRHQSRVLCGSHIFFIKRRFPNRKYRAQVAYRLQQWLTAREISTMVRDVVLRRRVAAAFHITNDYGNAVEGGITFIA
jgi:hypothetical protein